MKISKLSETLLITTLLSLSWGILFAQTPASFTYQAVLRDNGNVVSTSPVNVQIDILETTPTGTSVYSESHFVSTNDYGQITVDVGGGSSPSSNFEDIDWSSDKYFLQTQIDFGSGLEDFGATQLVSVPYSMQSREATRADTAAYAVLAENGSKWNESGGSISYDAGNVGIGVPNPTAALSVKGVTGMTDGTEAFSMGVDPSGRLSFYPNNMHGTGTPSLTLDDSVLKAVGIGTNTPTEKLHVSGGGVLIEQNTTTPSASTAYGNSLPIAYAYISGTTVAKDYGVTSVTSPSIGNYDITLDNGFSGSPVVMIVPYNTIHAAEIATYSYTGSNIIKVHIADGTGAARNSNFSIVVFGTPQ